MALPLVVYKQISSPLSCGAVWIMVPFVYWAGHRAQCTEDNSDQLGLDLRSISGNLPQYAFRLMTDVLMKRFDALLTTFKQYFVKTFPDNILPLLNFFSKFAVSEHDWPEDELKVSTHFFFFVDRCWTAMVG